MCVMLDLGGTIFLTRKDNDFLGGIGSQRTLMKRMHHFNEVIKYTTFMDTKLNKGPVSA